MKFCRVCGYPVRPFMTFGQMPIGNAFVSENDFDSEYFFELQPASCEKCTTFQIVNVPEPRRMFHDKYAYFASTSMAMTEHFRNLANIVIDSFLCSEDPFIVEFGSNDGISLQNYAAAGIRHLGVDPSNNVIEASRSRGISALCDFFDENSAEQIVTSHGQADVIISTNTMHHIEDIKTVVAGAKTLLKRKGFMITEDPYLADMIRLNSFEQIYAEHNFIWSVMSMQKLFNLYDMEIVNLAPNHYHGGCMRYFIAHKGEHVPNGIVARQLEEENKLGLHKPETFENFRQECETSRRAIVEMLERFRKGGKRIVGYGATAKSTSLVNYCGITSDHLEFICDTTPAKQGLFSPGAHIPIVSNRVFSSDYPDYALLFAWNHREEILSKEQEYANCGGKWIEYIPEIKIS